MTPPQRSPIARTVLRTLGARRSHGARLVGLSALAVALAAAARGAWLRRARTRFAAVRGPRDGRPVVALLEAPRAADDAATRTDAGEAR